MFLGLLLLSCLHILTLAYDFNLSTDGGKLMTWSDADGVNSSLLLFSLQMTPKIVLEEKMKLPYSFVVGQNCSLTQSLTQVNLLSPNNIVQIQLLYVYLKGQTIISSNSVEFTTNTTLNLDNDTLLFISSQDFLFSQEPSSSLGSQSSRPASENLYMYSNQTLISFDSKLFSSEPTCYMLSQMTAELCRSKQCSTMSPQQFYDVEIGTVIQNYSLKDGRITLPVLAPSNTAQFVYFRLQQANHTSSQLQHITQEKITISGSTIINVSFQISQLNTVPNTSTQNTSSSLRVDSPDQSITSTTYNVNITFTNSQPVYAIKSIKVYLGEQLIESNKVMFKPLQQINYSLVWRNDESQIPLVEIYSQSLILQKRYSMNHYVDFMYNQQKQLLKNSPNKVIQNDSLNEISTVQTHSQKSTLIILIVAVGGSLILSLVGVWCFRKRIFKRCYQQKTKDQKQGEVNDAKNDQICTVPQTAKEMKDFDHFTSNKREIFFKQTSFGETQETQKNQVSHVNPQEIKSKDFFSIDGQNPQNKISQKALEKSLPQKCK